MNNTSGTFLALLASISQCFAQESIQLSKSDATWEAIKIFEGNPSTISGDFDCQGMSVGIAQWNIGKSKDSVRAIFSAIPDDERARLMPRFGERLTKALSGSRAEALAFVRSLQSIGQANSCDAKTRNARWTAEGKAFVGEMSRALATEQSIKAQRHLRADIFSAGYRNADEWAKVSRGASAVATPKEVAYFVDMQNFNGGGFSKFGLPSKPLSREDRVACSAQAISYLRSADEDFLLHKAAARKNASLLDPRLLGDSEADLFCMSYRVALKLKADHARQFRLTVINRRAAILFGSAYYSDRDTKPTKITLPSQ